MNSNNAAPSNRDAKLLEMVLGRVDAERGIPPSKPPRRSALLLGSLIEASLINLNSPREELAQVLQVEMEFINALIDGELPEAEITDGLLVEIANAIGYEPNLLRVMLEREILPYTDPVLTPYELPRTDYFYFTTQPDEPIVLQDQPTPAGKRFHCGPHCPGHDTYSERCKPVPMTETPQNEVSLLQQLEYEVAVSIQPDPAEESSLLMALEQMITYNGELQQMQTQLREEVQRLEHELETLREAPKPVQKPDHKIAPLNEEEANKQFVYVLATGAKRFT